MNSRQVGQNIKLTPAIAGLLLLIFLVPTFIVPLSTGAQETPPSGLIEEPPGSEQLGEEYKWLLKDSLETVEPGTRGSLGTIAPPSFLPCYSWTDIPCMLLAFVNFVLDALFYLPTRLAEALFAWSMESNMGHQSATDPLLIATNAGYPLVLAIANMFFVLILLWTAIATIFDFETWGARQLLPKLIIAALLINFSLPIGRAIINLSNGIGNVFYSNLVAMGGGSITGVMTNMFAYEAIQKAWVQNPYAEKCKNLKSDQCYDLIANDLKVKSADGKTDLNAEKCKPIQLGGGPISTPFTTSLDAKCDEFTALLSQRLAQANGEGTITQLAGMVTAKIFLFPILIFVLFAGQGFLMTRMISLSFLLVLAPLAFLFFILPATRTYWTKWWENLFKWSFFLPVFLFFLWLSFAIITRLRLAIPQAYLSVQNGATSLDFISALTLYFFAAAFMIGSLIAASQLGIAGASSMIGLGKKMAGGAGRLVGRGALFPVRMAGRKIQREIGRAAHAIEGGEYENKWAQRAQWATMKIPGMRRGMQKLGEGARAQADEYKNQYANRSSQELARLAHMKTTSNTALMAIMEILRERRDNHDLVTQKPKKPELRERRADETLEEYENDPEVQDIRHERNRLDQEAMKEQGDPLYVATAKFAKSIGEDIVNYKRARPHLAPQIDGTSVDEVERSIRGEHQGIVETDDFIYPELIRAMFRSATPGFIQAMYNRGGTGARLLQDALNGKHPGIAREHQDEYIKEILRDIARNNRALLKVLAVKARAGLNLNLNETKIDYMINEGRTPEEQAEIRSLLRPERGPRAGGAVDDE